ncbi:UNVERIFIED_CONTAM: hypothetical protein K2H54_026362 [Gekko kuhli]
MRRKNSLRRRDAAVQDNEQRDHHITKDSSPAGIQDILDDLQVESVTHTKQETDGENQNSEVPAAFTRSHSPAKKKMDQLAANQEPQVTYKKCHYDTDEVRRYIFKQRQERSKKQSEQKKVQKEATLQRKKRLQELYKKQREALAHKPESASAPELVPKQLQETSSVLFLSQALLEEPQLPLIQDVQPNPGYHPLEDSNKEDKIEGHPPSTSSNSNMSLSEPHHSLIRDDWLEPLGIQPDRLGIQLPFPHSSTVLSGRLFSQCLSLEHSVLQKDFNCLLSTRSHSTAIGFLPLSSPPVTSPPATLHPTINQHKSTLDRIEALKAKAASLSSRIESEAKRLAGIGMDYGAVCSPGHNLVQGNQGDGYWVKTSSPPVREENDAFSATLQNMSSICASQSIFDNYLPDLENPGMGKTISPHTAATVSLPCKQTFEGIAGNLSKTQNSPNAERIIILHDCSVHSISEQWLGDDLQSEEDGDQDDNSPLKITETLKEKEFCVAGKTGDGPIEQFQKEAENYLPISAQMRSTSGPWEEITKGSPHSVVNIFTKSNQLCGQGFEEWSGQGSPLQQPSLPVMSPPASIVSYEDDFISSQGSGMVTDEKTAVEPSLPDKIRSPRTASCPQSPRAQKELEPVAEQSRASSRSQATILPEPKPNLAFPDMNLGAKRTGTGVVSDAMHFSPAGLQHQILAELHYLSTIEESLQQLSDVKQAPGISLLQQESVSLAQILMAQQKKHEWDLALLKLKAEQETLKEAQQKAAQPHAESLQQLVQSHEDTAGALQETACKIAAQQMEAALLTTAAAWQIHKTVSDNERELVTNNSHELSCSINITTRADKETEISEEFNEELNPSGYMLIAKTVECLFSKIRAMEAKLTNLSSEVKRLISILNNTTSALSITNTVNLDKDHPCEIPYMNEKNT